MKKISVLFKNIEIVRPLIAKKAQINERTITFSCSPLVNGQRAILQEKSINK